MSRAALQSGGKVRGKETKLMQDGPTDPSDWSFGPLKELDALLRCSICFEYFTTAMILSNCSHTYCSLCIRRFLSMVRPQCPTCSAPAKESQLVNNRPLDELVETFVKNRKDFMTAIEQKQAAEGPTNHPLQVQASESTQVCVRHIPTGSPEAPSVTTPLSGAKVPRPPSSIPASLLLDEGTEMSTGVQDCSHGDQPLSTSICSPIMICDDDDDNLTLVENAARTSPGVHSLDERLPSASNRIRKVQCPVCGMTLSEGAINLHLDKCLQTSGSTSRHAQSSVETKVKRLPKIVWNLLKDKDLKKKLKEYHLPATGRRHDMIQRLQEFSLRYNAQCDSRNPRTIEQVANDMVKEDLSRQSASLPPSCSAQLPKGSTEEEIEQSRRKYESEHWDQFTQLTREASLHSDRPSSPLVSFAVVPVSAVVPTGAGTVAPGTDHSFSTAGKATITEPADCCTSVPQSPEAAPPHRGMSKKRNGLRISIVDDSSCDTDGGDADFVEVRKKAKRRKQ